MLTEWITPDELHRATDLGASSEKSIEETQNNIAKGEPYRGTGWWGVYYDRLREGISGAVSVWIVKQDAQRCREFYHVAAKAALDLMSTDWHETGKVVYWAGKFYYLTERKGRWVYGRKNFDAMLEQMVPDLNQEYRGQILDMDSINPVVFTFRADKAAEYAVPGMEAALISGDLALARSLAEIAGTLTDFQGPKAYAWYMRVLKYALLGDTESLQKSLEYLASTPKAGLYQQLGKAYSALLAGDRAGVEQEFRAYLKKFAARRKPKIQRCRDTKAGEWVYHSLIDPEFLLCTEGLAFCKLAAQQDINLSIDEPFLPTVLCLHCSN